MYLIIKRFFDILLASLSLIILSPLLIPSVIGLKLTGEGEILYFQERVGFRNKNFQIYKFATMLKNSESMSGGIITTKNDVRITPLGGFLRKSKINELPQLLNILFGHMSVVGPRPVMTKSFEAYPEEVKKVIYNVKPGLTGIGSIIFRDEEALITQVKEDGGDTWGFYKNTIYPFKGSLEQWYQKNVNLTTDIKIVILTAIVIFKPNSQAVYSWFKELPKRPF
jgi:lipopolysaccharide/colanic/teichoic acid biosynthesis glycosyltransferase